MSKIQNKPDKIMSLALSFFLGASSGNWRITHVPTIAEPFLTMQYLNEDGTPGVDKRGKPKGRPFKLLNAAARPHKKIRMTKFFSRQEADLINQVIKLHTLKPGIEAADLVEAFNYCIRKAEMLINFRMSTGTTIRTYVDPNKNLRKVLRNLVTELLGPEYSTLKVISENGIEIKLLKNGNVIATSNKVLPVNSSTERAALQEMISLIPVLKV